LSAGRILVAPSLLAADCLRFGDELKSVEAAGADWHHVDVMDGHFVPNLSYGLPLVRALKKQSSIPLDVHIMVANPDVVAMDYVAAGADYLAFPIESVVHSHRLLETIQQKGAKAGVAINPGTALSAVEALIPYLDLINIMSVNPGFGGQKFIPEAIQRVAAVRQMIAAAGRTGKVHIEVDGGINGETGAEVVAAGATVLVAGTFVYGAKDRAQVIKQLATLKG